MTRELVSLDEGMVLAQYGPMRLTIQAWTAAGPDTALARQAGEFSFTLLPRLVPAMEIFRRNKPFEELRPDYDEPLFNQMIVAARNTGQKDLGPMATVAGIVSETVALYLKEAGAVKAIVENGGDVAVHLGPGRTAKVGVRLGLDQVTPNYSLELTAKRNPMWGLASSGLGGRSLTRGIADTALCVAPSCTAADAAATAVANAVTVGSASIKRVPAEVLRPDTDIAGLMVTESVGELTEMEIAAALESALKYAQSLVDKNIISGALIALRGKVVLTRDFNERVSELVPLK
ncbi:hypothetical protein C4J81_07200 [Deltaproteobacteria bacterium Smac51]|nr:hypothetical protein C4J81_07200 [Deltaproteobacteria bacterium Smac51]